MAELKRSFQYEGYEVVRASNGSIRFYQVSKEGKKKQVAKKDVPSFTRDTLLMNLGEEVSGVKSEREVKKKARAKREENKEKKEKRSPKTKKKELNPRYETGEKEEKKLEKLRKYRIRTTESGANRFYKVVRGKKRQIAAVDVPEWVRARLLAGEGFETSEEEESERVLAREGMNPEVSQRITRKNPK